MPLLIGELSELSRPFSLSLCNLTWGCRSPRMGERLGVDLSIRGYISLGPRQPSIMPTCKASLS